MAIVAELKAELLAGHPNTGPYNVVDEIAAGELNVINRTLTRPSVAGSEILNATDDVEYGALSAVNKTDWLNLCGVDLIDTDSGVAKALEADLFGGGSTTRTNLVALRLTAVSRAVELGFGKIGPGNVTEARNK